MYNTYIILYTCQSIPCGSATAANHPRSYAGHTDTEIDAFLIDEIAQTCNPFFLFSFFSAPMRLSSAVLSTAGSRRLGCVKNFRVSLHETHAIRVLRRERENKRIVYIVELYRYFYPFNFNRWIIGEKEFRDAWILKGRKIKLYNEEFQRQKRWHACALLFSGKTLIWLLLDSHCRAGAVRSCHFFLQIACGILSQLFITRSHVVTIWAGVWTCRKPLW
jgi:hypothetical protein